MDFSNKCFILGGLYTVYRHERTWVAFCNTQDVGLPLAYMVSTGLADPTPEGEGYINDSWLAYCKFLDIDPEQDFETLEETFIASPYVTLKED